MAFVDWNFVFVELIFFEGNEFTAIHIALVYRHNIRIPKHAFFNTNYINISPITNNINIVDKDNFYYREKIDVSKNVFESNHYKVIEILRNIFVIKNIS